MISQDPWGRDKGQAHWAPPGNQYGPTPPPPGYPPQYAGPQGPYPGQQWQSYPPRSSHNGLLIGAAIAAIVVAVVAVGAVVLFRSTSPETPTALPPLLPATTSAAASATPEPWHGQYSVDRVASACDLMDTAAMAPWGGELKELSTNKKTPPIAAYGGGELSCNADYQGGVVQSPFPTMPMFGITVWLADKSTTSAAKFATRRDRGIGVVARGGTSTPVTGIGTEAVSVDSPMKGSPSLLIHELTFVDSNMCVEIRMTLDLPSPDALGDVDAAAQAAARRVIDMLRTG
ncbi:hypothetical protein ACFWPX_32255 [Nocardia sp. NPDC058518]|uniref:hypothetical protein n=1 Tax=Nocardia sp. NPDC058518 TaxID=3346534 RepID=UPI00366359B8